MKSMFLMQNATPGQKNDKSFVIKAVSRPGIVTNIRYKKNYGYDPLKSFRYERSKYSYDPVDVFGYGGPKFSYIDKLRNQPYHEIKEVHFELEYVPEQFKNDKDVVLAAVRSDSRAIKHASKRLQNDPEIKAAANAVKWFDIAMGGIVLSSFLFFSLTVISPLFLIASIITSIVGVGLIASTGFFANKTNNQEKASSELSYTTMCSNKL